jgi:hypothetical protein
MRADQPTAEFGITGVLHFVETEHGLVKAAISLGGRMAAVGIGVVLGCKGAGLIEATLKPGRKATGLERRLGHIGDANVPVGPGDREIAPIAILAPKNDVRRLGRAISDLGGRAKPKEEPILMTLVLRGHKSRSSSHTEPASRLFSNRFCRS